MNNGKADLVVMEVKQNTAQYINVLEKSLFPFMNRLDTNNAIFDRTIQPYTPLSSRKTGLKQKIMKFWTGPLSLQI